MRLKSKTKAPVGANGDAMDRVSERGTERQEIVDRIKAWMVEHCPGQGVDVLLTRPFDAMRMALAVASESGRITPLCAADLTQQVLDWSYVNTDALTALNGICREAMCARKRGELKSLQARCNGHAKQSSTSSRPKPRKGARA